MDQTNLILSAQTGDLEAFNQLVLLHQDRAYATAYYLLNDEDGAADALQNALLLAFRSIHSFRGGCFKAWLLRILKNVCYDELRRRKRHTMIPLEPVVDGEEEFENPSWLIDHSQNPAYQAENAELSRAIHAGLQTLPQEYRLALVLVDIDGMDYNEAAQVMDVPVGTVKSRLARARLRLRGRLEHNTGLLPEIYARPRAYSFAH